MPRLVTHRLSFLFPVLAVLCILIGLLTSEPVRRVIPNAPSAIATPDNDAHLTPNSVSTYSYDASTQNHSHRFIAVLLAGLTLGIFLQLRTKSTPTISPSHRHSRRAQRRTTQRIVSRRLNCRHHTFTPQSSTTTLLHTVDGNGNVIGLVDMASGVKSSTYDYNAFGETIQSEGVAALANPFRFSTKYLDRESGLNYYGFRYYQPGTGRFLGRDPSEEDGGTNLYAFVENDGVNAVDFLGLWVTAPDNSAPGLITHAGFSFGGTVAMPFYGVVGNGAHGELNVGIVIDWRDPLNSRIEVTGAGAMMVTAGAALYAGSGGYFGFDATKPKAGGSWGPTTLHVEGGGGGAIFRTPVFSGAIDFDPKSGFPGGTFSIPMPKATGRFGAGFGPGALYVGAGPGKSFTFTSPSLREIPFIPVGPVMIPNPLFDPKP